MKAPKVVRVYHQHTLDVTPPEPGLHLVYAQRWDYTEDCADGDCRDLGPVADTDPDAIEQDVQRYRRLARQLGWFAGDVYLTDEYGRLIHTDSFVEELSCL